MLFSSETQRHRDIHTLHEEQTENYPLWGSWPELPSSAVWKVTLERDLNKATFKGEGGPMQPILVQNSGRWLKKKNRPSGRQSRLNDGRGTCILLATAVETWSDIPVSLWGAFKRFLMSKTNSEPGSIQITVFLAIPKKYVGRQLASRVARSKTEKVLSEKCAVPHDRPITTSPTGGLGSVLYYPGQMQSKADRQGGSMALGTIPPLGLRGNMSMCIYEPL